VNGKDPSGLAYLTQQVSTTFYVDDEGIRWLVENGIENATNPGWSKRTRYENSGWYSSSDAAFMSLVANYVTMPNQAGQKGMYGSSNNPVKRWPNHSMQPEIVVEADRVPITLGIITDSDIDRIASTYAAEGSFPWNLSEVLDISPQYALWDFKRKKELLPYKMYWYNGAERQRDEIGNIIWGRVMASSGWPLSIALGAAGAYQTISGDSDWEFWKSNWQNLGDDPRDSRGIQLGYSNGSYAKIMTIRALQGTLNIMLGTSKSMSDFQSIHRLTTLIMFR
jgi:hypothetical protein